MTERREYVNGYRYSSIDAPRTEGWSYPPTLRSARPGSRVKLHYFRGKRSLCGKWEFKHWYQTPRSRDHLVQYDDFDDDDGNCVACSRERQKENTDVDTSL